MASSLSAYSQTDPILRKDAATAPKATASREVQAQSSDVAEGRDEASLSFASLRDVPGAGPFLHKVGSMMLHGLEQSSNCRAFDAVPAAVEDSDDDAGVLSCFRLSLLQPDESEAAQQSSGPSGTTKSLQLPCCAISWNESGSLIAGAFGYADHDGWCRHKGGVAVWRAFGLGKQSLASHAASASGTPTWAPEVLLEVSSCVTSVSFNPHTPGLLAAGTASGEIMVWDVSVGGGGDGREPPVVASHPMDDFIHRDSVVGLQWVATDSASSATRSQQMLMSLSSEGRMHVWSLSNGLKYPVSSGQLRVPSVKNRVGAGGGKLRDDDDDSDDDADDAAAARRRRAARDGAASEASSIPAGACCIAAQSSGSNTAGQQNQWPGVCFVGGSSGSVYQVSLTPSPLAVVAAAAAATQQQDGGGRSLLKAGAVQRAENTIPWEHAAVDCLLRVPDADRARVCRAIERHAREVGASTVTLPLLYAARPEGSWLVPTNIQLTYHAHTGKVKGIAASPFHRNLFASAGADGQLCVYSALLTRPLLVLEPAATSSGRLTACTSCAWSRVRPLVLAAGCADGSAHIYDLFASTAGPVATLAPFAAARGASAVASSSSASASATTSLLFNPRQRRVVAVGDAAGRIRLWRLPWRLGQPEAKETSALQAFLSLAIDAERHASGSGEPGAPGAARGTGTGGGGAEGDGDDGSRINSLTLLRRQIGLA